LDIRRRLNSLYAWWPAALAGATVGAFAARLLYELWPAQRAGLSARPGVTLLAALALFAALGLRWLSLFLLSRSARYTQTPSRSRVSLRVALIPFFLFLVYILWPSVNLRLAFILLAAALVFSVALALHRLLPGQWQPVLTWAIPSALVIITSTAYGLTVGQTVGAADTFEFQVVAPYLGIVHPTGYPLFLLLAKLFSLLPFGSVAWRVNLVSVTFGVISTLLVYACLKQTTGQRAVSALAALCLAFSRVFWSQAVEAEVYLLNAAFVAAVLWLLTRQTNGWAYSKNRLIALAGVYGLSFTNHLTMALVAPPIALSLALARPRLSRWEWLQVIGALLLPLLLILYTPLRWPALHNGEWMSFQNFIGWITGQQFRGALQLGLWRDPARWNIVRGLLLDAFGPIGTGLAVLGLVTLAIRQWRTALVTALAWAGYFFYGLVYNVPDVSVFVIPAYLVMAIWIGAASAAAARVLAQRLNWDAPPLWIAFALLPLSLAWTNGPLVDQSRAGVELIEWGKHVMGLPMPSGSAILADSEKIAPLYYLKRIEHLRPDVDTLVLGDEGAYRSELDQRVAKGQPVYLARYLPGLAGPYRLHSLGPLVRVTTKATMLLPPAQKQFDNATWGNDKIALLGVDVEPGQANVAWRVTFYWQALAKLDETYHVRLRWVGPSGQLWWQDHGAHPVHGYNPTVAWQPGEIIADYHEIPANATFPPGLMKLEVGWFLPFREEGLQRDGTDTPWFTPVLLDQIPPRAEQLAPLAHSLRALFGNELLLTGANDLGMSPPGEPVNVELEWASLQAGMDRTLQLRWLEASGAQVPALQMLPYAGEYPTSRWLPGQTLRAQVTLTAPQISGTYSLRLGWLDAAGNPLPARCAWLAPVTGDCAVSTLQVQGAERPADQGINFDNQVVLLNAQPARTELRPNETLDVQLEWQGRRPWNADYTVFVHLLGPDGQVHGQVDQWPLEGTLATRDWQAGRILDDVYHVTVPGDAPTGEYQIEVGWYLLATLRRLPVVDASGRPMDDRVLIGTVMVR